MHQLKDELNLIIDKVDISINDGRLHADKYHVKGYPTIFVLKNKNIIDVIVGVDTESADDIVKENLKKKFLSYN